MESILVHMQVQDWQRNGLLRRLLEMVYKVENLTSRAEGPEHRRLFALKVSCVLLGHLEPSAVAFFCHFSSVSTVALSSTNIQVLCRKEQTNEEDSITCSPLLPDSSSRVYIERQLDLDAAFRPQKV